jgi:hypothetical protein
MTQEMTLDPLEPAGPHLVSDTTPPSGRNLRIVSEKPRVDLAAAERAAEDFLAALGIDGESDGLRQTPARMARAYAELFDARPFQLTTFPNPRMSNGVASAGMAAGAAGKTNSAPGSTKRRISQAHAARSTWMPGRVAHFTRVPGRCRPPPRFRPRAGQLHAAGR